MTTSTLSMLVDVDRLRNTLMLFPGHDLFFSSAVIDFSCVAGFPPRINHSDNAGKPIFLLNSLDHSRADSGQAFDKCRTGIGRLGPQLLFCFVVKA
jgi:hypothetical protein